MASVVCQGLQSCLEPRVIEPLVLMQTLTTPKSLAIPWLQSPQAQEENPDNTNNIDEEENDKIDHTTNNIKKNGDLGGWNFLDALANPTQIYKQVTEKVYVHPMEKRSASALSLKSLEMCTEGLGCETGSDISESSDEFCTISWEKERLLAMQKSKIRRQFSKKIVSHGRSSSFPPPLTSISGYDGVRVRPHREDGRLVLRVVNVTSSSTCFQAERTNGSLKLSLLKDCSMIYHSDIVVTKEEIFDNEEEEEDIGGEELYDEVEGNWDGDMEGNVGKVECEIGIAEVSKPSRCKEGGNGNKGISNWGSFWVPIS